MSCVKKATQFSVLIYAKLSLTLTLVPYVGTLNSRLLWLKCKRKTFKLSPVPFLCRHTVLKRSAIELLQEKEGQLLHSLRELRTGVCGS